MVRRARTPTAGGTGRARLVVLAVALPVAAPAACAGGGISGSPASPGTRVGGGSVVVQGCNPQNPLVPSNTTETCGGNVLDASVAKLVHYDPETAAPEYDIAESITTGDNQHFTVTLVKGYRFQDGTEVKARNFVDAWNYAAYGPNGQSSGYFMEPIEGYDDLQCPEPTCTTKPRSDTMTGLRVVDDHTFTIRTGSKVSNLPVRLGYSGFAPLPDAFFKDPKGYGDKPISAGPYQVDSWVKNTEIRLSRFEEYSGKYPGKVGAITFRIYQDPDAAYNDVLANRLDITTAIPSSAQVDDRYKSDLPDRYAQKAAGVIRTLTFPSARSGPSYAEPRVRQAISMAIDRDTIVRQIFNNARKSATGWVSPVVDGYRPDACGEYCRFDPGRARSRLDAAGGFKGERMTLTYNADEPHKAWAEAACNSVKNVLGVACVASPVVDFATLRDAIGRREITGMFVSGWQMDYPSIENFLAPIFRTGAWSNDSDYSNPAFDRLTDEAAAATDPGQATAQYQQAERLLAAHMPAVPLWYDTTTMGWSAKVTGVKITAFGTLDYSRLALR